MKWTPTESCAFAIAIVFASMLCDSVRAVPGYGLQDTLPGAFKTATGKYISTPNHGELDVLEQPGEKIKFGLTALWVGNRRGNVNTGATSGVVPIRHGVAIYKNHDLGYTITMRFRRDKVIISYAGEGFGGLNVDPTGTYKKVNSRPPTEAELNPPQ